MARYELAEPLVHLSNHPLAHEAERKSSPPLSDSPWAEALQRSGFDIQQAVPDVLQYLYARSKAARPITACLLDISG